MAQLEDPRLQKLRSGIFQKTDIVEMDFKFERLYDKGLDNDKDEILNKTGLFVNFETLLKAGPLWKFNPTCLSLFIHNKKFKYDSALLIEDIKKRGVFTCKEVDKNLDLYEVRYSVRLLQINTHFIKDDVISATEYVCIETVTGKIVL